MPTKGVVTVYQSTDPAVLAFVKRFEEASKEAWERRKAFNLELSERLGFGPGDVQVGINLDGPMLEYVGSVYVADSAGRLGADTPLRWVGKSKEVIGPDRCYMSRHVPRKNEQGNALQKELFALAVNMQAEAKELGFALDVVLSKPIGPDMSAYLNHFHVRNYGKHGVFLLLSFEPRNGELGMPGGSFKKIRISEFYAAEEAYEEEQEAQKCEGAAA